MELFKVVAFIYPFLLKAGSSISSPTKEYSIAGVYVQISIFLRKNLDYDRNIIGSCMSSKSTKMEVPK